ncbi:MAG: hypothetical protein QXS19_09015 [Candidatus Methanomethylicia archaeon]
MSTIQECIDILLEDYPDNFSSLSPQQQKQEVLDRFYNVISKIRDNLTFISVGPAVPPCANVNMLQNVPVTMLNVVFTLPSENLYKTTLFIDSMYSNGRVSSKIDGISNFYKLFMSIFYDALCVGSMTATFASTATEIAVPGELTPPVPQMLSIPQIDQVFSEFSDYIGIVVGNALKMVIQTQMSGNDYICKIRNVDQNGNLISPDGEITLEEVSSSKRKRDDMYRYIFNSMKRLLFDGLRLKTLNTYTPSAAEVSAGCPVTPNLPSNIVLL